MEHTPYMRLVARLTARQYRVRRYATHELAKSRLGPGLYRASTQHQPTLDVCRPASRTLLSFIISTPRTGFSGIIPVIDRCILLESSRESASLGPEGETRDINAFEVPMT
jgi:hypothetical protein